MLGASITLAGDQFGQSRWVARTAFSVPTKRSVPSQDFELSLRGDSETESHRSHDSDRVLDRLSCELVLQTAAVLHGALGAHAPAGLVHDDS